MRSKGVRMRSKGDGKGAGSDRDFEGWKIVWRFDMVVGLLRRRPAGL